MQINIDFANITKTLQQYYGEQDFSVLYRRIAKHLHRAIIKNFQTEGRYFGGRGDGKFGYKWFDLAPSTIKGREKKGYTPINILRRRAGDAGLLGSIVVEGTADGIIMYTNLYYGIHIHYGTKKMPPRPFFPVKLPEEVLGDIAKEVNRYFKM